ncbi:hypothetical protein C8Q75DRAFT_244833 [Abortiporus biennis]|nr:hypothetical protein C8Q75DRAFT_244833 [Abortiporus biennis]
MYNIPSLLVTYPSLYLVIGPILAFFAISSSPSFTPTVLLVACLRLSALSSSRRHNARSHATAQVVLVSLSTAIASLIPSIEALSTPTTAILVLTGISTIFSAVAYFTIILSYYAERQLTTAWPKLTILPALWSTAWGSLSHVSSFGQLATWSPVLGLGPYEWTRSYLGQWEVNWITASWAVILSDAIGIWIMGQGDQEYTDEPPLIPIADNNQEQTTLKHRVIDESSARWTLFGLLVTLMLPSYASSGPLPVDSLESTPLGVACALPVTRYSGKYARHPTIDDYILESKQQQGYANIVLWPESAVRFNSPGEKDTGFKKIQEDMQLGRYYGVSFDEYVPPGMHDGIIQPGYRRNGFALLGARGPPVLEYYKRNLVPIAESFSLTPGTEDPSIFTMHLRAPKTWNKTDWEPSGNHTRPISVTASICLDFSSASAFNHLETRPSIILAPARTWHRDIGLAMWEQAKVRAAETGSTVLWCDGGDGGVSGVAGGGFHEYMQAGQGTWRRTIGIQYPFNEKRTFFMFGGDYSSFIAIISLSGIGWLGEIFLLKRAARASRSNGIGQSSGNPILVFVRKVYGQVTSGSRHQVENGNGNGNGNQGQVAPTEQTHLLDAP